MAGVGGAYVAILDVCCKNEVGEGRKAVGRSEEYKGGGVNGTGKATIYLGCEVAADRPNSQQFTQWEDSGN